MTSHANCTHPKTKAARAACRAGRPAPAGDATPKASKGPRPSKRQSTLEGWDRVIRVNASEARSPIDGKLYISGHCALGNHDRCAGVYAGTTCTCTCNHSR